MTVLDLTQQKKQFGEAEQIDLCVLFYVHGSTNELGQGIRTEASLGSNRGSGFPRTVLSENMF